MNIKNNKRASMNISKEAKELLDSIKHSGQSYDGLIRDLIRLWQKEHGVEEGERCPKRL